MSVTAKMLSDDAGRKVRVQLVQMEVLPGRPAANTDRILATIAAARQRGIELAVFPELAVPGYLLGDEWERPAFLRDCEACGERIRAAAAGITVIFGNVAMDWQRRNEDGRVRKYNALFVARDGAFIPPLGNRYPFVIKTLLPNYREFDDSRHFYDLRKLAQEEGRAVAELINPVAVDNLRLGCVLCEDGWDRDYAVSPARILSQKEVDLLVSISCSPFTTNKNQKRHRVFSAIAGEAGRPLLYVNNVGLQNNGKTVFTFDGGSCLYDSQAGQVAGPPPFTEGMLEYALPVGGGAAFGAPLAPRDDDIGAIYQALIYGTGKFMESCGVQTVTVGASGGIDSAVVAALYARILPPEKLLLVNMPSRHNSQTTRTLARELARNLGCYYADVSIEESVRLTAAQVDGLEIKTLDGGRSQRLALSAFMLENVQARDRSARLLAAVAAAFGGVFTCNGNKSEVTVGYCTLYGDLCGYLANLADLWKGEVYALGRYLNATVYGRAAIPEGCFTVTPSAELSPAQAVDEGKGDPLNYPYHDCLFRSWVERWDRATPEECLEWYLDGTLAEQIGYAGQVRELFPTPAAFIADLERWWNQYQGLGVAKRIQAPPVLAVKRRAFGFDHRESQLGARYTEHYLARKREVLGKKP